MSKENRQGLLIVLSGPSGVGKDAAIHRLKEQGLNIHYVVTATTRAPRDDERDGIDYHFLSKEQFEHRIAQGEFLEWSWVHGNLYGPPVGQVRDKLADGHDVLLKIDVQGAAKVKQRVRDAVFIYLAPPSLRQLVERLRARGSESPQELELRIANAYREMESLPSYDYVVVNEDGELDRAVDQIRCIITAERLRVHPRRPEVS
jgi:guanylate kinase